MVPMKAPLNVLSLSISGTQYPVVDGVIQVQPAHVRHALAQNFKLLSGMNADELVQSDIEAALVKAQAAIPIRGIQARNGMKSLSIEGVSYVIGDDGYVEVPENLVPVAMLLGCEKEVPLRERKGPPLDKDGLRTDGPTLAEFLKAGYLAGNYPPKGYADKRTPEELEASKQVLGKTIGADASKPALPTVESLKAMSDADLRAFMKSVGVEFLGDAKRKDMDKAAKEWLEKATSEQKD